MTYAKSFAFPSTSKQVAIPKHLVDKYPELQKEAGIYYSDVNGLTKREYFAAMAMQGLCSTVDDSTTSKAIASDSVLMADALIAELSK